MSRVEKNPSKPANLNVNQIQPYYNKSVEINDNWIFVNLKNFFNFQFC